MNRDERRLRVGEEDATKLGQTGQEERQRVAVLHPEGDADKEGR